MMSDFEAGRSSKTKRKHNFDSVREPLLKLFQYARQQKTPVSGEALLLKAQEYAQVCGCENIEKLDMNCMNWWKAREEIACKKLNGKAESVDLSTKIPFHYSFKTA